MLVLNPFAVAAMLLCAAFVPCAWVLARADTMSRLVALELAGTVATSIALLLPQAAGEDWLYDVTITMALLSYCTAVIFANFLGRSGPASS